MSRINKPYVLERLVYVAIWLIVFFTPVMITFWLVNSNYESVFNWQIIIQVWGYSVLPFFLLFCLNNFWLLPRFFLRKKYISYSLQVLVLVGLFIWINVKYIHHNPVPLRPFPFGVSEHMMDELPEDFPDEKGYLYNRLPDFEREELRDKRWQDRRNPEQDIYRKRRRENAEMRPLPFPGMILMPAILQYLIAILMIGFNIAVKLLFKSMQDEETMKELERRKLQSELKYLKYQVNPHFFMNTLNNIHALVDVDREKARKAIVELSKMMRYMLYESNDKTIPLAKEIQFLNNYIELMKLRFTEQINVKVSFPDDIPSADIPPLLYISFIENAFKHGVSYRSYSLICVAMQVEETNLVFTCSNTNNRKKDHQHRGVGLENIQKRLKLLYGDNYTLSISENEESFNVLLIIPLI